MEYLGTIIIAIVIFVAIYLLLREVNCWYWKVNKRIILMEENNKLLKTFLSKNLSDTNDKTSIVSTDSSNVTEKEAKSITVRHKVNKREQTVDLEYWEKIKKLYGEENFEILKYNK
jgi:hypothetical protein